MQPPSSKEKPESSAPTTPEAANKRRRGAAPLSLFSSPMMTELDETPTKPFHERYPRPSRWRRRGDTQAVSELTSTMDADKMNAPATVSPSTTPGANPALVSIYHQTLNVAQVTQPSRERAVRGSTNLRPTFEEENTPRSKVRNAVAAPPRSRPISFEQARSDCSSDTDISRCGAYGETTVPNTEPRNKRRRALAPTTPKHDGQWGSDDTTVENTEPSPKKTKNSPKAPPVAPDLTKKSKKVGYGFSFSDSLFIDSDDPPDTDEETESDTDNDDAETIQDSDGIVELAQNTSFTDVLVLRDAGSFNLARPQEIVFCTHATNEDTLVMKNAAKALYKYAESGEVQETLLRRVERMVLAKDKIRITTAHSLATVTECSVELRNFLMRTKEDRIQTGEMRELVEHEVEWAVWLVEASRAGVLHVKSSGCGCRPGWAA